MTRGRQRDCAADRQFAGACLTADHARKRARPDLRAARCHQFRSWRDLHARRLSRLHGRARRRILAGVSRGAHPALFSRHRLRISGAAPPAESIAHRGRAGHPWPRHNPRTDHHLLLWRRCALLALWLRFTSSGLYVRAVSQDPSVARMMGINADRLSLLVTSLSAAFAGIAGVLAGPYLSIDPGMDVTMIVNCLIIVVIGGTGSIGGAIVAALLFGLVQVAGSVFLPNIAALVPYILLMAVLLIAPRGIGRGRVLN